MTIRELLTAIVAHQPYIGGEPARFDLHKNPFLDADVLVCDGRGVTHEVVGQCLKHDPSEAAGLSPYTLILELGDDE
jgi:hypothetical protein